MNELYEYDTQNNSWTQRPSMAIGRDKAVGAVIGNKFYVIGGETSSSGSSSNRIDIYDTTTNTWANTSLPTLPYSAHSVAATTYNGKIYTFGGRSGTSVAFDYAREYNPTTNQWATLANMPTARYGAGAVELNGKIYVVGGYNSSGTALKTMDVYDPAAKTWDTQKAAMPSAKGYCGVVVDDGIYVIGGSDDYASLSTVYQYNPNADKWYHWPGLDNSIEGIGAAAVNEGIYIINGYTYIYNSFGSTWSWSFEFSQNNYYAPTKAISSYAELTHLGSDTINLSGNLSRRYSDLSFDAPGFTVNASRVYNSIDTRNSLISKGWSFGFSSKLETEGNNTVIRMPDGSARTFKLESNNKYTAKDSRAKLDKDGLEHILTTPDHYKYLYNEYGYLYRMCDPNDNQINFYFNSNKQVNLVTDAAGRNLTIDYVNNRISTITEPTTTLKVSYDYDGNGRLSQVTAPDGGKTFYTYNSDGLLYQVKDHNSVVLEQFTYETPQGSDHKRIKTAKLPTGNTETYVYNVHEGTVTTTTGAGAGLRTSKTYFDKALYPILVTDAEGGQQLFEYNLSGGINRYGEITVSTDRNGNTTFYEYDSRGNVIKVINPDRSTRLYEYNASNDLTKETDELGHKTFYVYDSNHNLVAKLKPFDGVTEYTITTPTPANVFYKTSYNYYSVTDATAMCGRPIKGLLKKHYDGLARDVVYTYDTQGNLATTTDQLNRTTTYSYNTIGWLKQQTSPMGYTTTFYYDKCGRLLKKTLDGGESERYIYDLLGNLKQSISPKQYATIGDSTTYTAQNIVSSVSTLLSDTLQEAQTTK